MANPLVSLTTFLDTVSTILLLTTFRLVLLAEVAAPAVIIIGTAYEHARSCWIT